ncbi:MAG: hypothetical protein WCO09_05165, partial [bacterium]
MTKSPWPKGRIGPVEKQDWFKTCVATSQMHQQITGSEVVITSSTKIVGADWEEGYYIKAMKSLGCPITTLGKGKESIAQLRLFQALAKEEKARLILIVTWSHYLRILWLCRRKRIRAKIVVAGGFPRPWELFTDIIMTFL